MITLHKYKISASIKDRYANIMYCFDFENTHNIGSESSELKFEITIDEKAFISKFEANIDGELFVGKTKEKETASKEYNDAKEKNENAILISQPYTNITNVFQIQTNIDAKSKVLLTIQIEQYLQKRFGLNELCVQILRNFDKYNIEQKYKYIHFNLDIMDKSGIYDVDIPMINKNDIFIDDKSVDYMNKHCYIIGKIMNKSSMNELILKYKIKGEQNDSHILFDNKSNTFCHIISDIITDSMIMDEGQNMDEIKANDNMLIPRRVMFVIDRSGSMIGYKWRKTISATITAIKQLRNGYDRFGIILFDNNIELLPCTDSKKCVLANNQTISDSIIALQKKAALGGTNINDALLTAIECIKMDILFILNNEYTYNLFMNQLIFITDGEPNNGECDINKIITNVKKANDLSEIDKYQNKINIFSFGVGKDGNDSAWINDLNHSFLKTLSVNNNGFYQRIKQSTADQALCEYFDILSKPVLTNINIQYENKKNIKELTETKFNTLYSGNDLIICGKLKNKANTLSLTISAITGIKQSKQNNNNYNKLMIKPINILKEIKINLSWNTINNDNTDRIWAYLKLQQLAKQKLIHFNDMIEIDDDEKQETEELPLALALKYKFVTPWTSMIVVKKKDDIKQDSQEEEKNNASISSRTIEVDQLNDDFSRQNDAAVTGPTHFRKCSNTTTQIVESKIEDLVQKISERKSNFRRRAPPFSRTLRPSSFTYPATSTARRTRKLLDIQEIKEKDQCFVDEIPVKLKKNKSYNNDNDAILSTMSELLLELAQLFKNDKVEELIIKLQQQLHQIQDEQNIIVISLEDRKGNKKVTIIRGFIERSRNTENRIKSDFMKRFGTSVIIQYENIRNNKGRKQIELIGDWRYDVMIYLKDIFGEQGRKLLYYQSVQFGLIPAIDTDHGLLISPP